MDEFSLLKAGTFEARMKEVVREAEDTVVQTKKLSVLTAKLQLSMLIRQGRLGGYKETEKEKFRSEIMAVLDSLGIDDTEKAEALSDFHRFTLLDIYYSIAHPRSQMRGDIPSELASEWHRLSSHGIDDLPSADDLEDFFKKAKLWEGEIKERVEDYRYYASKKVRRRPPPPEEEEGL